MAWRQAAKVVVSGTYRKDVVTLRKAHQELLALGCQVLSPRSVDFTTFTDGFAKTDDEQIDPPALLENQHLRAISQSDFVWLHAPDGYVGLSGALEIGYAFACGVPVFCKALPDDIVLRHFVHIVERPFDVLYIDEKTDAV